MFLLIGETSGRLLGHGRTKKTERSFGSWQQGSGERQALASSKRLLPDLSRGQVVGGMPCCPIPGQDADGDGLLPFLEGPVF
jgi:hypothetical protein